MRIAIIRCTAARVGGTEAYLDTVTPALAARGHDVATLYEEVPDGTVPASATHWVSSGGTQDDVRSLEGWNPDVVYVNGVRSLDLEARAIGVAPAVAFAHSYLGTCISGTKTHAAPRASACRRAFGPACLAMYYPRRCGGISPVTMWRDYRRQQARLALLRKYARILVASRHMASEYERHGLGSVTRVVPLPVTADCPGAPAGSRDPSRWRLLYLGRLEWPKGPDLALAATAFAASQLNRPVTLTIAGMGTMSGRLQREADKLHQRHSSLTVVFPGWVDRHARASLLAAADLLLVPSRWPEPFGLAGIEAGLHGVPAVGFATGGIPEWLADGRTGVLVNGAPPDAPALARGIVACLHDPQRLARMGEECRRATGRFGIDAHVRALEAELDEAVERRRMEVRA